MSQTQSDLLLKFKKGYFSFTILCFYYSDLSCDSIHKIAVICDTSVCTWCAKLGPDDYFLPTHTFIQMQSSGAVWKKRGGCPGLLVSNSLAVSVDVRQHRRRKTSGCIWFDSDTLKLGSVHDITGQCISHTVVSVTDLVCVCMRVCVCVCVCESSLMVVTHWNCTVTRISATRLTLHSQTLEFTFCQDTLTVPVHVMKIFWWNHKIYCAVQGCWGF